MRSDDEGATARTTCRPAAGRPALTAAAARPPGAGLKSVSISEIIIPS
jgi:hypothetical protein